MKVASTLVFLVVLFSSLQAKAKCFCACVDGENIPICTGSLNIEPICPIAICP